MVCHQIVEKITEVNNAYARKLSCAGRLRIVNGVFFSIFNFQGGVFILPQSVLKAVDRKCKDFLWGSSTDQRKAHLVAWDKVCLPMKFGGQNVKGCRNWNEASVGKLLRQVSEKQDILVVKWVHGVYLKQHGNIWNHIPPTDCSWYWRKLTSLKTKMTDWYQNDKYKLTKCGTYSVTRSYNALIGAQTSLWEANLIWTKIMQPKHRFIVWLANQNRLLTKSRMMRLNIHVKDAKCCLCLAGMIETPQHLFSECQWKYCSLTWSGKLDKGPNDSEGFPTV